MPILTIATHNRHKTKEIGQILGPSWHVRDLSEVPGALQVEETGKTFEENAALKALAVSRRIEGLVLADDSGLEVEALEGAPGVYSARYAGRGANDQLNRELLVNRLRAAGFDGGAPGRFRCVMVLASDGALLGSFHGVVEGQVLSVERGTRGFGYDPLFVPEGYSQTFGELPGSIKNTLSHRARALAQVIEFLKN
jgi:XTP/dITP diphosphohydrolase